MHDHSKLIAMGQVFTKSLHMVDLYTRATPANIAIRGTAMWEACLVTLGGPATPLGSKFSCT